MQPGLRNQIQRWIAKTDLSVRAPGAEWDVELETYRLSEITRIDFGGDYEDALNLYGGCKYRRALEKIEELKNLPKFTSEEKRAGKMPRYGIAAEPEISCGVWNRVAARYRK